MESGCQNAPEFVSNLTAVKVCILKKLSCRVFLKIILVAMNCTVHILLQKTMYVNVRKKSAV